MGLISKWFIGVPEERKEEVEGAIKHSRVALDQLVKIIESEKMALDQTTFIEDYETPAWDYKQADRLGQLRAYRKILALINF